MMIWIHGKIVVGPRWALAHRVVIVRQWLQWLIDIVLLNKLVINRYCYNIYYIWYTTVNFLRLLIVSCLIITWYLSWSKLGEKQQQISNFCWAYLHWGITTELFNSACTIPHIHILIILDLQSWYLLYFFSQYIHMYRGTLFWDALCIWTHHWNK